MKFAMKGLAFVCAFMIMGSAQAESQTLTVGGTVSGTDAYGGMWTLGDLSGSATLNLSNYFRLAVNTFQASITQVAPATLTAPTSTTTSGVVQYMSASAAAPVTSLTMGFDASSSALAVEQVATSGGFNMVVAKKNGATLGAGSLSITNLNVDIATKSIYADINGANGVGTKDHFLLWTFDALDGSTTIPATNTAVATAFKLTGLWAPVASIDMLAQALNLNYVGRSALNMVNRPTADICTVNCNVDGFGSLSVLTPVPEPATYALMSVGLVGMSLVARRRAR